VLCNQWLLALQGLVIVIVILTMGTWIGHVECKEDIVDDSPVALWRSVIERLQETIIDIATELRLKQLILKFNKLYNYYILFIFLI